MVADMDVDMVADMEVDMVADMEVHMVVDDTVADMVATTVFERGFAQSQWIVSQSGYPRKRDLVSNTHIIICKNSLMRPFRCLSDNIYPP